MNLLEMEKPEADVAFYPMEGARLKRGNTSP